MHATLLNIWDEEGGRFISQKYSLVNGCLGRWSLKCFFVVVCFVLFFWKKWKKDCWMLLGIPNVLVISNLCFLLLYLMCIMMCVCVYACKCMYVCLCVHTDLCVCTCECMCVCMCIHVSTCVREIKCNFPPIYYKFASGCPPPPRPPQRCNVNDNLCKLSPCRYFSRRQFCGAKEMCKIWTDIQDLFLWARLSLRAVISILELLVS